MLVHMSVINVDNISHYGLSLCFWQFSPILVSSSIFYYPKKMDQRQCVKFCVKNETKFARMWHLSSLLWVEHKFNCGITVLRKTEKMSMTMLVLVARARQKPTETLKLWRKWFWIIFESLQRCCCWCWLMPSYFYWQCRHETWGSEDCSKINTFWAKIMSHGLRSGDDDPDLLKKTITAG